MSSYLVSEELRSSIESLFRDPAAAFAALGVEDGQSGIYETDLPTTIGLVERLVTLKRLLEGYLNQMAEESAEIGCDETTDTLRMQAIGLLIALREIQRHAPEVAQYSMP